MTAWEQMGKLMRLNDLDLETNVRNNEVRIFPPESGEMNQYKVD